MTRFVIMDDTPFVADWDIVEAESVDEAIKKSFISKDSVYLVAELIHGPVDRR